MLRELETELEDELIETGYESSFEPRLVELLPELEAESRRIPMRPLGRPPSRPFSGSPAAAKARRTANVWVRSLVPLLDRHRGIIPLEFLIGWIDVESGGNIREVTSLDERGYFQIHPQESQALGLDHRRLSTDPEYSIIGGIKLVQRYMKRVQRLGFRVGSDLFWHLVKLLHWLPRGVTETLNHMKRNGFRAADWQQFRDYMVAHRSELLGLIKTRPGTGWDPISGIRNVEKLFERGRALAAAALI